MTYDNTDERGEDAVARQRGGSERPQHVDTCRVYNCYGCEEIVGEPGHLPECPDQHSSHDGTCICDRLRACEARVRDEERPEIAIQGEHDPLCFPAIRDVRIGDWGPSCFTCQVIGMAKTVGSVDGQEAGYAAALDAARDAVAALGHVVDCMWSHEEDLPCPHEEALAVIDALRGES